MLKKRSYFWVRMLLHVKKENDKLCVINKNGEQIGGEYDSIDNYSNEDKSET